jgi:hypothetical protein
MNATLKESIVNLLDFGVSIVSRKPFLSSERNIN